MNFFNGIYTLQEIAIKYNFSNIELSTLSKLSNKKEKEKIMEKFPVLNKFIPYCELYENKGKFFYAMPSYIYDTYVNTGFLIDVGQYDTKPNVDKKEYWQYNPSISLDLKPQEGWEFAESIFKGKDSKISKEDIWSIFLSGCARMDYYQEHETEILQRIKYAIVEYMLKRPQFFNSDDFVYNPVLHKKYKIQNSEESE